jgi:hypothetical protein
MAALVEQLPPLFLFATSAMVAPAVSDTWSHERIQVMQHEAVAKLHYQSRVSSQAEDDPSEKYEFEAIPLVAAQTVRVRFRDIGQLPPPSYFKDEPVLDD